MVVLLETAAVSRYACWDGTMRWSASVLQGINWPAIIRAAPVRHIHRTAVWHQCVTHSKLQYDFYAVSFVQAFSCGFTGAWAGRGANKNLLVIAAGFCPLYETLFHHHW